MGLDGWAKADLYGHFYQKACRTHAEGHAMMPVQRIGPSRLEQGTRTELNFTGSDLLMAGLLSLRVIAHRAPPSG